jgi:hypothetical protein
MTQGIKFQTKVHFRCGRNGRKHLRTGETPAAVQPGRSEEHTSELQSLS